MELKVANLKLTVYEDESLTQAKRVVETDELKIPYRTATYIIDCLDKMDFKNTDTIIKFITGNVDKLDKVIKATFGVSEAELDCLNTTEVVAVGVELYKWCLGKLNNLNGGTESKNAVTAAE